MWDISTYFYFKQIYGDHLRIKKRKYDKRIVDDTILNDKILRFEKVLVIDEDKNALGEMTPKQALELAEKSGEDIVCVSPNATVPVCRMMNYGKFKFEKQKKDKQNKKNQVIQQTKEIRITSKIEQNDINTKAKNAIKFLKAGDKVKISVRFRGREMAFTQLAKDTLNEFIELLSEHSVVEKQPKLEGRTMFILLAPKK